MVKVGGEIHRNQGRKCTKRGKIGGEIRNLWSMTKKRSSEILADENKEIFREKVKLTTFSTESENFSKIGGKSETGVGNASWSQRGWTPLYIHVL